MINYIYKRAFSILTKMPIKLWGLSLLNAFLTTLILIFGVFPIITIPVIATLSAGVTMVYLDGYNGKEVYSDQLFSGFKNFTHVAGGMCWKNLWLFLWLLVPIAGPIIVIIKSLSYAFTPYILNNEPSVNATEALRKSMKDTKGYKTKMFLAIILPCIIFVVAIALLGLLSRIPFVGLIFAFISFIVSIVFSLFSPLFFGLVEAGFYEYSKNAPEFVYSAPTPQYTAPTPTASSDPITCGVCNTQNAPNTQFCYKCGAKLN